LAGLLLGGGLFIGTATMPAFADGPPVPAGCTFDQANGVRTCVVTTTTTKNLGPFDSKGVVPSSTVFGGFTGEEICVFLYGPGSGPNTIQFSFLTLTATATVTTTTEGYGLAGKVFDTSSVTTNSTLIRASAPSLVTCG
jgi:hypothetical protein